MKKTVVLITLCVLLFSALDAAAQSLYVSSMKGSVNVRSAASTAAPKIGTLSKDDLIPCLEELDGWYKVDLNGKVGFVSQSVASTCDAVIPDEMFGKDIESSEPWDKIRHQGTIRLDKIDQNHVAIHMDWMRVNLPAESTTYIAEIRDGKVVATHCAATWVDTERPIKAILEDMGQPLEKPIPIGFNEFGNTIYFNGAVFSEYD